MKKIFITLVATVVSQMAFADYPERSIRLVVPFATGGTSEIIARSVASSLTTSLGQSVYVDNKPGAAGNIAMEEVKRAKPDGYTLMLGHVGTLAVNPALFGKKLPYDPNTDFAPVTLIAKVPNVIAVSEKSPNKTLADFVADAKKNPGKINYGSAGNGSAGHLAMEYFSAEAGIDLVHVPYKGSGPMLTDLIGSILSKHSSDIYSDSRSATKLIIWNNLASSARREEFRTFFPYEIRLSSIYWSSFCTSGKIRI